MNIAFVPVRCGSKSIPFKNIKLFCGRPLVYWNLKALQETPNIDTIILATDCEEIKSIVSDFGFSKVITYDRDSENASDTASTESVMLEFINKSAFIDTDLFILVQATSPLTETVDFENAIEKYKTKNADSMLSCVRTKRFFWKDNGQPFNYDYAKRPRRQEFDGMYLENGAFYINTFGNIKRYKNRLSGNIAIYEMPEYTAIEIDEEDDWMIAEHLMYRHILSKQTRETKIKLFLTDVDGTLTDAGMYYDQNGNELKKFNTRDGKGLELLKNAGIKTGIITSESTKIVENRARKLKVDYLYQGIGHEGKLNVVVEICKLENISLMEVAYIGDDVNCMKLLENVGYAACPNDAVNIVKNISNIRILNSVGGKGAVREFIDLILTENNE